MRQPGRVVTGRPDDDLQEGNGHVGDSQYGSRRFTD
jgi:hypothetical protein